VDWMCLAEHANQRWTVVNTVNDLLFANTNNSLAVALSNSQMGCAQLCVIYNNFLCS